MTSAEMVNAIAVDALDVKKDTLPEFALSREQTAPSDWLDICRWEDEGGALGRSEADGE
ncbi:hypothetical protein [Acidicapsa ligni]|uniref:hypothetical protein n=1 Tax=Acidicapsa ligni TaxID=542300 RepID=UPI0021DFCFD2|nr:hypothetical protein [Acidicapsa ligni]